MFVNRYVPVTILVYRHARRDIASHGLTMNWTDRFHLPNYFQAYACTNANTYVCL